MDKQDVTNNQQLSLGEKLASARQKKGLSENDIAAYIHVRRSLIVDIENNNKIDAPFVFYKGYIRSYADFVGLSEEDYLAELEQLSQSSPQIKIKSLIEKEKNKHRSKKPYLFGILLLVIIIGMTLFFTQKNDKTNLVEVSHYISPTLTSPTSTNS